MTRKKLHLVADQNKSPIPTLSSEEEARALQLADVALHAQESQNFVFPAGGRAIAEHRLLIEELQREAEKSGAQNGLPDMLSLAATLWF